MRLLPVSTPEELTRTTVEWNDTSHELADGATLASLLGAQVQRTPHSPAITFDGETLSFAEFDDRVGRMARLLIAEGVGPETRVAIAVRRSIDLLVAVHATIQAGGAYVPVDPDQPSNGFVTFSTQQIRCVWSRA